MEDYIFSLDIGTRNVVGIVATMDEEAYKIIDYEIMEHPERAMYDGQIHDIDKVSRTVKSVKENLEERLNIELSHVSIAAAGRALKTHKVFIESEIDYYTEIQKSMITSLEIEGIQKAQNELESISKDMDGRYYCVGYTVINYYLDGNLIGNLRDHRGKKIGADILATFLPHIVVDSLYTVVNNVGLEVVNLTLEPIAAINVAIPSKFRLLNLALVDIGAGTSDIAITKDGSIVSYAMVSVAGDEITEELSKAYLLDFNSAEKLKTELNQKSTHSFTDIVGISYELETEEIILKIENSIKSLCENISKKIVEYNGSSPSAVFCIGGGSQVPKFTEYLADSLELPKERVVVRGTEILENVVFDCEKLLGPEYITPIGIGYTAFQDKEQDFLKVKVDGKLIRLFNSKRLTVSDALILVGFNARSLISKRGKALTFNLNGKNKVIYGEYGDTAKIFVNGKIANLETNIKNGDEILIDPAIPGKDASVRLIDLIDKDEKIILDGKEIDLYKKVYVNGERKDIDYIIQNDDEIEVQKINDIIDLAEIYDIDLGKYDVYVKDKIANKNYKFKNGDGVRLSNKAEGHESNEGFIQNQNLDTKVKNREEYIGLKVNGEEIKIEKSNKELVFVDIFEHIDFDISKPKGILELKLNGKRASYTDILQNGDIIEIYWR